MADARDRWDDIAARHGYPRRMWKPNAAFLYYERAEGEEDGTMLGIMSGYQNLVMLVDRTPDTDPLLQTLNPSLESLEARVVLDTYHGVHRLLPEGKWCDAKGKTMVGLTAPWQSFQPAEWPPKYTRAEDTRPFLPVP